MIRSAFAILAAFGLMGQAAPPSSDIDVRLWRLDCGTIMVNDLNAFSDTDAYTGQSKRLTASCYLIRHGDAYMLWDTGIAASVEGQAPERTLVEQLAELNLTPDDIGRVGISHFHFDHIGQAASFPKATLLIGAEDWAALSAPEPDRRLQPDMVRPWISDGSKVEPVSGDLDIFGDGTVRMIDLPGHTPGHHALLVKLRNTGYVLLSGDQAHFTENYESEGVPGFNTDRADTLASFDRFKDLAANLKATVIIQHEPADIGKLPAFPESAD